MKNLKTMQNLPINLSYSSLGPQLSTLLIEQFLKTYSTHNVPGTVLDTYKY